MSACNNITPDKQKATRRPRILLGVTGSVAAVKAPEIAVRLSRDLKMDVRILSSRGGRNFWDKACDYNAEYWNLVQAKLKSSKGIPLDVSKLDNNKEEEGHIHLHDADEEWNEWNRLGDPVLHIDLRDWADAFVIAPLSAHTLVKLAQGMCDDTLSCVARAWDFGHGSRPAKPLLLAPAMNTAMWQHPLTQQQLSSVQSFWNHKKSPHNNNVSNTDDKRQGVVIIAPQVKTLACGEVGNGALAAVDEILSAVSGAVSSYCQ